MEPKKYWRTIHEIRNLTKRIRSRMCREQCDALRKEFVQLEDLVQSLIEDFRDKEGY